MITGPPKILVFAGSIRSGALSAKLAALTAKELAIADADVTKISLADYPLPIYNGDLEAEKGIPENANKLARLIAEQQGVFIATPEYNNSLPPLLKNTIDWVSRIRAGASGIPYRNKVYGIGSTSDGLVGGARALIDLRRVVLTAVGAILIPEKIEVNRAQDAFDESGEFVAEAPAKLLKSLCRHLVDLSRRLAD
jgi:NAD(P)H-dependent FMN reductase